MRILHLLYDHPDNPWLAGGGAVRAMEINRRLVRAGDEVVMVCGGFPGRSGAAWSENGISIHTTRSGRSYFSSRIGYNATVDRLAKKLLKEKSFDLLVHDLSPFSWAHPWRYYSGASVALLHNLIGQRLYSKLGPLALPFLLREKKVLQKQTRTIAVSQWLARSAESLGAKEVRTVYNGVDPSAFEAQGDSEPATVLFLGRLDLFQKGLDTLLKSMALVRSEMPDARLVIAGAGPDEAKVKRLAAEWMPEGVTFLGKIVGNRFDQIARATVVALPSRFEGWGIVAIEAAAVGRAAVGMAVDGLSEAIDDGHTGLLVRGGAEEFAAALLRLLRDSQLRNSLGSAGRRRAEQFNWDRIAEQQRQVYAEAIDMTGRKQS